jgi:hypothetical protein
MFYKPVKLKQRDPAAKDFKEYAKKIDFWNAGDPYRFGGRYRDVVNLQTYLSKDASLPESLFLIFLA